LAGFCAQPAYFERVKNEYGLNSNYVVDILQRQSGFIWMATSDGLSRFDGYEFINFVASNDPKSIPSSWVNTLYEDRYQQLWVGTDKGLARLDPDELGFTVFQNIPGSNHTLKGSVVSNIVEDSQGRLWVATNLGLNLFRPESQDFLFIPIDNRQATTLKRIGVNFVLPGTAANNGLWVATELQLLFYDFASQQFSPTKLNGLPEDVELISGDFDSSKNIWFATAEHGVFKYNPSNQGVTRYQHNSEDTNSITTDFSWNIMVDRDDRVWVGSWGEGLSQINPKTNNIKRYKNDFADQRTIPSNLTTRIMQDQSGLIWVGTYNGIAHFQPNQVVENFRPIPYKKDSLSSETVWSIAETEQAIWIGTTEGLNRRDKSSGKITNFHTGHNSSSDDFITVWTMENASNDNLWLGTDYGPALFDTSKNKLVYLHQLVPREKLSDAKIRLLKKPVWAILADENDTIWVGTNDGFFYQAHPQNGVLNNFSELFRLQLEENTNMEFLNIAKDQYNNFWLSTTTGLYFFDSDNYQVKPGISADGQQTFKDEWIYATAKHSDSQYWIGSQSFGLSLIELKKNGSFEILTEINEDTSNMIDKGVYSVFPVSSTNIWFNGVKNLYEYDLEKQQLTNYGGDTFPPDNHFHEDTQFIDSSGYLYFGSTRGAYRFKPQDFRAAEVKRWNVHPPVVFTEIESNSFYVSSSIKDVLAQDNEISKQRIPLKEPLYQTDRIILPSDQNMVTFRFAALNYANSQNSKYSYRLGGETKNWVNLEERREITFTNLKPGEYELEVRATAGRLGWNNNYAKIAFEIETAIWSSAWAYSIYIITLVMLSFYLYRSWRQRLITQYKLNKSQDNLDQALWGSGDEHWEWDVIKNTVKSKNRFTYFEPIRNLSAGNFKNECQSIHPDDLNDLNRLYGDIVSGRSASIEVNYRRRTRDNQWVWLFDRAKVSRRNKNGHPITVSGTTRNVDQQKQIEKSNLLLASAFQSTRDASVILDRDFKIISINPAMTSITGYDRNVIGQTVNPRLLSSAKLSRGDGDFAELISKQLSKQGYFNGEAWIKTSSRKKIPIDLRIAPVTNWDKSNQHYIATLTDIRYRVSAEEELKRLANFDSLTGLPNRALLYRQLNYGILQADRDRRYMSVLFIDLDHFKNINDSLGHSVGDQLLQSVARRLEQCVRRTDIVARLGGDEFTIGLFGSDTIDDITRIAENILAKLATSFILGDHEVTISPSIGVAIYRVDGDDVETLLRNADIAMYHAKNNGRNKFEFFSESMNERVVNRIVLEKRIRRGLKNGEFFLHYQPKFCAIDGRVVGFEALARWQDPEQGLIFPDGFIPISEETGLMIPLGNQILETACKQLKEWQASGHSDITLAINLSAIQFGDKNLLATIKKLIESYELTPSMLDFEITESALIENMRYTIKTLNSLREMGVRLSLDDFGTGYSSLNYLKEFPIHTLKIDRSFVREIESHERDAKMVASIVALAHNLDIEVVGEGVETQAQLDMMNDFHVEQVQGFFLSKPIDASQATEFLISNHQIKRTSA
jgi:diguanylate cyclase (GGDEF)-like protein/PAS domain S-box-containing protein